jgi:hypothetical protein
LIQLVLKKPEGEKEKASGSTLRAMANGTEKKQMLCLLQVGKVKQGD